MAVQKNKTIIETKTLLNKRFIYNIMASTITVNKQAILDLVKVKEEFNTIIESIELMSNADFMNSYKRAKEQIRKRDFADWNEL